MTPGKRRRLVRESLLGVVTMVAAFVGACIPLALLIGFYVWPWPFDAFAGLVLVFLLVLVFKLADRWGA